MDTGNQIKSNISRPEEIDFINTLLKREEVQTRTEVALKVCEEYGFKDPVGRNQLSGCLKALRELEAKGLINLPEPRIKKGGSSPRRLNEPVAEPLEVPSEVGAVLNLRLELVEHEDQIRIWNELMICEHPQGAGTFIGRQIRYLVNSSHGWLGAIGFAAAARHLEDRDRWIGWDTEQRRKELQRVVCLSRFLIRPSVHCRNLSSRVLSMSLDCLVADFLRRYHYKPLLVESFVDTTHYTGVSYRASNWIHVGRTKGRGRQDRFHTEAKTIKDVYVYPLEKDFRAQMGLPAGAGLGPLGPVEGVDGSNWARQEMGGAPLGDARLGERLVEIVQTKAKNPGIAYSGAAEGNISDIKAYYRFIDHPDEQAVTMETILKPHRQQTIRRMQGQQVVLCIQDGSDLNYNSLAKCEGLGVIGINNTGGQSRGLHLHSTMVLSTNGLPLGILRAQCAAPVLKSPEDKRPSHGIPIEDKNTFAWIKGFRDTVEVAALMPNTRIINVCDREADFFELFEEQKLNPTVDLLVRANHNRVLNKEQGKLFEALRQAPIRGWVQVPVPRQSARPKNRKANARPKRLSRKAELEVRYLQFQLLPNSHYRHKELIDGVWCIHAVESNPPEGIEPIEWFLLTTVDIRTCQDAIQCLRWYCLRWRIEDFHRVLKSGCGIEEIAHETAERMRRAIAICMVIAWRIMLMTLIGRVDSKLPPDVIFSDIELRVLHAFAKKKRYSPPQTLRDAVRLVARIGGYMARKNDPEPGHQVLWRGFSQLQLMVDGFVLNDG